MKQKIGTKALSWLLSFALMLSLLPGMSLTALAATSYNVWIGGVEVTSDNSSGTGWSYDSGSNTLTLNGYQYSGDGYKYESTYGGYGGNYAAIYAKQDLTISLTGESTVTNTVDGKNGYNENNGVFVDGKLTIQGEGQVTVNGKTAGIRSKSLQIDSGTVNASCDVTTLMDGSIVVTENGLTINGGNVTANGKKGIDVENGDVSITGGTVNAVGSGYQGSGIYVENGDVTISGGKVTAISTSTSNSSYRNGIYIDGSGKKLTIGASVTSVIVSGTDGAVSGNVVNAVAGIGWDNKEGTGTATDISISTSGQKLNYKKAQFPAPPAYMEATVDETTHEVTFSEKTCTDYTKVTSDTTTWSEGWYVVSGEVTIGSRITVSGTVNLILCDNCTLTASQGITVGGRNTLNIYAQSEGDEKGTLTATGYYYHDSRTAYAGIGGDASCGTVNIYGGTVNARGGQYDGMSVDRGGAGIGGSHYDSYSRSGGAVTIYGGTVTATGGMRAAGIGGGGNFAEDGGGSGGTLTVYGGTVTARGGQSAAGIGGGSGGDGAKQPGSGGTVKIFGGTVTAIGSSTAGIGGAYGSSSHGTLEIGDGLYLYKNSVAPNNVVVQSGGDYARAGSMYINSTYPHAHDYTCSASGAVITMTCSATGSYPCELPTDESGAHTASLTISPPVEDGVAIVTADPSDALDVTQISVNYQSKENGNWTDATTTPPTGNGIHRASITYNGASASVTYGLNCVTYVNEDGAHGTVSGPVNATVGATITPTITPDTGYEIDKLTVTKTGTTEEVDVTNNESFIMPEADVTISATFKLTDYSVTISTPNNHGTVTASKSDNQVSAENPAHYQDTITLTLAPDTGCELDTITVKDSANADVTVTGTGDTRTFTMPASDVTVTATFKAIDYHVTITSPIEHGTVTASKGSAENPAHYQDTITLTLTPDAGYALDTLTVKDSNNADVSLTGAGNTRTFTMPASDVTVSATFTAIPYHVTVDGPFESGAVTTTTTPEDIVYIGDKVTLTVTPDEGYGLKSITTTCGTLNQTALNQDTGALTYELTVGAGDAIVTAEFSSLTTYTIFYNASSNPSAVSIKMTGEDGAGYAMTNSAKLGNINCWSTQVTGGAGSENLFFSVKEGNGEWTTLTVPVASVIPDSLAAGSAVAIEGEADAFVVAFVWGENTNTDSRYYLVTKNTASIDVPNPANTGSATFAGWTYLVPQAGGDAKEITVNKAGDTTTVSLTEIKETTIVSAIWTPNNYTVRFDPDNGAEATISSVAYGNTVTQPTAPTKEGYEFAGWVLADTAVEKAGDKTVQLSPGTAFDFGTIKIINDLSLKAKWKHVHSYACLQLDNAIFGGAFEDFYDYKGQLHIKLCTSMDDYSVEAHSFVNGKCACGASILDDKVTLTKYVGAEPSGVSVVKNSIVAVTAPEKQDRQIFSKWQYSADTTDGQDGTWTDLSPMRGVAFAVSADLSVKALYENDRFKLTINSFKYDSTHVAFQFNYSVPDGFTVVDGGLMIGDNVRMKFWDCTIKSFLGNQYEPSLRDAVNVYGGGMIANKMFNYQTINEPGLATPIKKALKTFGKTGTVALAWQPYTSDGYKDAIRSGVKVKGYDQAKYPTYAMGYIVCKDNSSGGYAIFATNAISATLESPTHSNVTEIPVS